MAKSAADKQSRLANNASGTACVLAETQVRYLQTVHKLLVAYQRASGMKQKHIFVKMIHAFMQALCSYPLTGYTVTKAVYSNPAADSCPHVVPTSYSANSTLFYFTAAQDPDDVHDLWVKHAQVYLAAPRQGDIAAACATRVVFSNFFIIDGASKDAKTGAWHLWSVSDIEAAQSARVDLRILESETELPPTISHVVQTRLQMLQYQTLPTGREPNAYGSAALAGWRPTAHLEGHGA
jgi:hypothetical protein